WTGGHQAVGTTRAGREWLFAEGSTYPGFNEFLTIQNPSSQSAKVHVKYLPSRECPSDTSDIVVGAAQRKTINVADEYPAGCVGLGADVTSDVDVIVERPMYFIRHISDDPAELPVTDGHVAFGVPQASADWYFAEGTTLAHFYEFLTLAN